MQSVTSLLLSSFLISTAFCSTQPKVNFSSPTNNSNVTSPATISVTAQGGPRFFILYSDGKSVKHTSGDSINSTLPLTVGTHTLKAIATYSSRSSYSTSIEVVVKAPVDSNPGGGATGTVTVAQQIAQDMEGSNEGEPHGAPAGWFEPSIGEGNNPQGGAIEFWGGLYVGPNGNSATNTMVNVKNCAAYVLSKSTNKWSAYTLTASDIDGGYYSENFSTDYGTAVPMRHESDGSFSFNTVAGKVAHFYGPWPRISNKASDFAGMVTSCDARLILNNANGTDDRSMASFVMNVGADPYPTTTGSGIENNPNIGFGKFKYVEVNWRSFSMTTLSEAQLAQNPPPVSFAGINP